jgi:Tfp pilus assembly protein PilX
MDIKNSSIFKNQSGAALVIALIMMIVLTLIGLASIFTSTFDIKISGNKRGSTDAFYAADSGVAVVTARIENFNINLYNTGTYNPFTDPNNVNTTQAQVNITHEATQEGAPRGYGFSAINFEFEHFLIASTGRDRTDINPIRSTSTVQEKLVRLVPTLQGGY